MKINVTIKAALYMLLVLGIAGNSFNLYEIRALPMQPTVDRRVAIDLGRGPKRYGTRQEYIFNVIALDALFGAIFFILIVVAIGKIIEKKRKN